MYKTLIKIFLILVFGLLQLVFSKFSFWGISPNIILILAIILVVNNRYKDSLLVGIFGGFILDLLSPLRFGINIFLFILILILIHFLLTKYISSLNIFIIAMVFVGAFLCLNLGIVLFGWFWPGPIIFVDALINTLWGLIVFQASKQIFKSEVEIQMN
jgi:hypothetical protein